MSEPPSREGVVMDETALQNTARQVASPAVLDELRRVQAICNTMHAVAQVLEAQMMESLWKISKEVPERPAFERLVREHTNLQPERAWLMAQTWESARRNRDLRELALDRPSEALALVSEFVEAGLDDRLESLSDDDREVAAIIAKPPRKRTAAIRELIAQGKAAQQGRSQADDKYITRLEAQRDDALAELKKARQENSGSQSPERQALNALRDAEKRLAQACEDMRPLLQTASKRVLDEAQRLGDTAMKTIEELLTDIYGSHKQVRKEQAGGDYPVS